MPLYEYECPKCWEIIEQIEKINVRFVPCTKCAHPAASRIMSRNSFRLRGGGWDKPSPTEPTIKNNC